MARCQDPHAQPGIPQKCRSSLRRWLGDSQWSSAAGMSSSRSPQRFVSSRIRIGPEEWNPPESSKLVLSDAICTASLFFWLPRSGTAPDAPAGGPPATPGLPGRGVPGQGRAQPGAAARTLDAGRTGRTLPGGWHPGGLPLAPGPQGAAPKGLTWWRTRWRGDQTETTPATPTEGQVSPSFAAPIYPARRGLTNGDTCPGASRRAQPTAGQPAAPGQGIDPSLGAAWHRCAQL